MAYYELQRRLSMPPETRNAAARETLLVRRDPPPGSAPTSADASRATPPATHRLAAISESAFSSRTVQLQVAVGHRPPDTSTAVIQRQMPLVEQQRLTQWVANSADDYLSDVTAGLVTNAAPSNAVRFRWFRMSLGGTAYSVGLNIHYGHPGAFGALWITNQTTNETMDFHPHANPQHGLPAPLVGRIKNNHEGIVAANLLNLI